MPAGWSRTAHSSGSGSSCWSAWWRSPGYSPSTWWPSSSATQPGDEPSAVPDVSVRVKPGGEPFRFDGGPVGALLLHGFSGSPASMRPLGEFLAAHGIAVSGPRLPGHGTSVDDLASTTWEQWLAEAETALGELESRSSAVVCVGLSMGG